MNHKFAFAVNSGNRFMRSHFGDADKYLLYEIESNELKLVAEEKNIFKHLDEEKKHGSQKKGSAIIKFLVDKNVKAIVSLQFGRNIKMVNKHFIPIIIQENNPDDAIVIINKHLHWIKDEWEHKTSEYNLFMIKNGILKSKIK